MMGVLKVESCVLVYRITAEDFKIHPELLEMSGDPDAIVANKQAQFGTYRTSKL